MHVPGVYSLANCTAYQDIHMTSSPCTSFPVEVIDLTVESESHRINHYEGPFVDVWDNQYTYKGWKDGKPNGTGIMRTANRTAANSIMATFTAGASLLMHAALC